MHEMPVAETEGNYRLDNPWGYWCWWREKYFELQDRRSTNMPIFEYRCKDCGHVSSFLEKAGTRKRHACEKCGSKNTQKIFSTFAARAVDSSGGASSCPTGTCPLS